MPAVLTSKAQEMLGWIPPMLADEPWVQASVSGYAGESQRIEDSLALIRSAMIPVTADDVVLPTGVIVPIAQMWELLLGLPTAPEGVGIVERRAKIVAHIRKLNGGTGSDWVANLSEALGTTPWTYEEGPGDYQVTIRIPYVEGSFTAEQAVSLARLITPAHLELIPAYSEGFLIGISEIGDAL